MSTESSSLSHLLDTSDPPLDSNSELHIRDIIQSLEASMEAALTQLSDSRATTARLEEQIGKLGETLRKYRALFAPVKRVPPELVSHILRYALPDDYVSGSRECVPWSLGHICRSWRVTALADSFLWSFIAVGLPTLKPWAQLVPALKSQLSRTNNVPLSVFISGGPSITQEVLSILCPTAPRWRLLRFHQIDEVSWITKLQGHLPSLERLEFIDSSPAWAADVFSQNVPRLRIVDLFEAGFSDCSPTVDLPFSQLTHYRAAWSHETHATNLLGAPNLEVCVLGTVDALLPDPLPQTAHLPRLRALHLESLHFLRCIIAPALEHLAVFSNSEGGSVQTLENVLPFLQRSGCVQTLRRLAIMECETAGSDIIELLRTLASLEAFVLESSANGADPSTILAALTIGDDAREQIICPKLASLTYGHLDKGKPRECLDMLPALALSRAQFLSKQSQRFELSIYEIGSDCVVLLEPFKGLADDGVDLLCVSATDPRVVKERWGDF
ncbi:hypothetical protein C8F01DRAFT_1365665 [Mycena amicta]|nr:hypothetical protein C8F01DRAFT_1233970 [Mycena amicta]KAJ7066002.1 hypothetical protein C8F01DRAFT_1365665 [Mycena amicta]